MTEFSEDLSKKYTGATALAKRIEYRAFTEKYVIPYSLYGVDYGLFSVSSSKFRDSLEEVMKDLNVPIQISGNRITIASMVINPSTMEIV